MLDFIGSKKTDNATIEPQENETLVDEISSMGFDSHESSKEQSDSLECEIPQPLSPKRHKLSLEEPTNPTFVNELIKYHSMFDGELKGMYADPVNISNNLELGSKIKEIHDAYSSSNENDKRLSFILAYKDQDLSGTQVLFAHDEHSEKIAVDYASDFFERSCGYKDFTTRWLTDYCNTSIYAHDLVQVITATNTRTDEREVIYVSSNVGVIRHNNLSKPSNNNGVSKEDLYEERPISSLSDVECIITGLTIIGYLSFGSEELKARNTTIEKSAKIMVVRLSTTTDYIAESESIANLNDERITKYISGISSNDPAHTRIWYSSTGEDMDYSSYSHKMRWSKVNKTMKKEGIELPPPAQTLSEKIWVYGSMTNSTYYRLYDKRHLSAKTLQDSLLFSEEFLRLFVAISNKQGGLAVRRIAGAKDGYHIFLNCKKVHLKGLFRPKNTFELDVSPESDYWETDFSIFETIIKGWSNNAIRYENWNSEAHEYDTMQGSYKQLLSHWLFTLVTNLYFDSSATKKPRTLRPKTALHSLSLKNVKVISKGLVSSLYLKNHCINKDFSAELADSTLFGFQLGYVQTNLGYSLFEITASKNGIENTYSFFLSSDNNGLIASDDGADDTIINIVVSNEIDVVEKIWCVKDVNYALFIAKDAIRFSDLAKSKGMDVYDAMREIDKTANSYGVDLKANFNL